MNAHDLDYFLSILSEKGVITNQQDRAPYETGWRGEKGSACAILRPETTEQVSKVVAYCTKHNIHIIPQSGNTGLVAASSPNDDGMQVILNLERMNRISELDPINNSIQAGAGVRLSALNAACEPHDMFFPIDLSADPCIGGMIATNTGGSRFVKYRGVREHLLGIKAVLADQDGTIIDILSPIHKNNTGLDTKQLFVGTGGLFGVITEAVLRLSPTPKQSATALLIPTAREHISTVLNIIEQKCGVYLSAFEGMSGQAIKAAFAHSASLTSPFGQEDIPEYAILLELSRDWNYRESEQTLDEVLENVLADIWERNDAPLSNALIGDPEKLWALRHALSEGVQKSGKLFAFDLSFKRGDVMEFISFMQDRLSQDYPELSICDFGHIGDGAIHFNLILNAQDERAKNKQYETNLRDMVIDNVVNKFNGSFSAEHGLGRINQRFFDTYTPNEIKSLTRMIKEAVAPGAISAIRI